MNKYAAGAAIVGLGAWIAAGSWGDLGLFSLVVGFFGSCATAFFLFAASQLLQDFGFLWKTAVVFLGLACTGAIGYLAAKEGEPVIVSGGLILAEGVALMVCLVLWLVFMGAVLLSWFR